MSGAVSATHSITFFFFFSLPLRPHNGCPRLTPAGSPKLPGPRPPPASTGRQRPVRWLHSAFRGSCASRFLLTRAAGSPDTAPDTALPSKPTSRWHQHKAPGPGMSLPGHLVWASCLSPVFEASRVRTPCSSSVAGADPDGCRGDFPASGIQQLSTTAETAWDSVRSWLRWPVVWPPSVPASVPLGRCPRPSSRLSRTSNPWP